TKNADQTRRHHMTHGARSRRRNIIPLLCFAMAALCALVSIDIASTGKREYNSEPEYDVVILNGRVIDPESGLDAIRSIGINKGIIQAVSDKSLKGRTTVLATGLVVAPG